MLIRKEESKDYEIIYSVVKGAFNSAEHADGNEHDLVNALRNTVLVLAPLSVLPEYQRRGIGMSLIKEGHSIADKLGYGYSIVLGSEKYYPKAGYVPADSFGMECALRQVYADRNWIAVRYPFVIGKDDYTKRLFP